MFKAANIVVTCYAVIEHIFWPQKLYPALTNTYKSGSGFETE